MAEKIESDVVVLGGGPGGYTAAFRAADLGLSVCLIEQHSRLGGVCLNVGCIPSKTLLHAAGVIEETARAAAFGLKYAAPDIDLDILRGQKDDIIGKLTGGLDQLCKARKIKRVVGRGVFQEPTRILVSGEDTKTEVIGKDVIIATGSSAVSLPNLPEDQRIWDSTAALELREIPKRLLIIGAGIIGMEMAQVYSSLGSEITIVEMLDQIIPPADKDLVQPLLQEVKKKYRIFTGAKVTGIEAKESGIEVDFEGVPDQNGGEFDAVLVAIGRRPNSKGIGLETIGLNVTERGFIEVDQRQRTAIEHVYAIGDVVGEPQLAHKATHQSKVAAEVIAGKKSAFTPMTIPSVAYTIPEVAWMGITEKEAKAQGIAYRRGKFAWGASGRALSAGATNGASKALFDEKTGRIIGAGICGLNAGELIHEAVLALEMGADAEDISKTIHAHPTLSETFAFAAEMVDGSITDALPPKK